MFEKNVMFEKSFILKNVLKIFLVFLDIYFLFVFRFKEILKYN